MLNRANAMGSDLVAAMLERTRRAEAGNLRAFCPICREVRPLGSHRLELVVARARLGDVVAPNQVCWSCPCCSTSLALDGGRAGLHQVVCSADEDDGPPPLDRFAERIELEERIRDRKGIEPATRRALLSEPIAALEFQYDQTSRIDGIARFQEILEGSIAGFGALLAAMACLAILFGLFLTDPRLGWWGLLAAPVLFVLGVVRAVRRQARVALLGRLRQALRPLAPNDVELREALDELAGRGSTLARALRPSELLE